MKTIWVIMREDRHYVKTRSVWLLSYVFVKAVHAYASIEDAAAAWRQLEEDEIKKRGGLIEVFDQDTDHPVKVHTRFWLNPPVTLT